MPVEQWSEDVSLVHLATDPVFTEEMQCVETRLDQRPTHVVLDFAGVQFLTSSNLARLLKIRKRVYDKNHRMVLCSIPTKVWTAFMVTGLDKVFEFSDAVPTALAMVQLAEPSR